MWININWGIKTGNGRAGIDGTDETDGTNGIDGQDRKSAYRICLDLGNTITESDFINALKGPQYPAGKDR